MSYEPIVLVVPVVYAALQYDALNRFTANWRAAAFLPMPMMMIAFALQVMVSLVNPMIAFYLPLAGLTASCVYLSFLIVRHDRMLRLSWEAKDEAVEESDNVVKIVDFR